MHPARLVTADELERMPDDFRYELVEGRLVPMSPVDTLQGVVVTRLVFLLDSSTRGLRRQRPRSDWPDAGRRALGASARHDGEAILLHERVFMRAE